MLFDDKKPSPLKSEILEFLEERMGEKYHHLTLEDLPPVSDLIDAHKGASRLIKAIKDGEKVGLYADYDADGTTSISVLSLFIDHLKEVKPEIFHKDFEYLCFQPNRLIHGYGLNEEIIRDEMAPKNVSLVITMDCGISDVKSAKVIKDLNMSLVVTDHHSDGQESLPVADAVVNPKRRDVKTDTLKNLAGVGVTFYLCRAVCEELKIDPNKETEHLLDLVAVGTIGDLVKLDRTNFVLVNEGIKIMRKGSNCLGIKELLKDKVPDLINSEDISFFLAPVLNAKGRLGDPSLGRICFTTKDEKKAKKTAKELVKYNDERKKIQAETTLYAINKVIETEIYKNPIIVIEDDKFHMGVMGIVASKIVSVFKRPCVILTDGDNLTFKASCRSYAGLDLYQTLKDHGNELFDSFGGHKEAAGFSIKKDRLKELRDRLNTVVVPEMGSDKDFIEIENFNHLDIRLALDTIALGPYGQGHKAPKFKIEGIVREARVLKDKHLKLVIENDDGQTAEVLVFNYYPTEGFSDHEIIGTLPSLDILSSRVTAFVGAGVNFFRGTFGAQFIARSVEFSSEESAWPF